ncbi:MAG: class II fructose-bisphosphate aldolase [Candidatus Pacebacteria bacterium]|nr:class II fructose-bisphosphate aldolase [Candidatus Paceibacterota bacterium]
MMTLREAITDAIRKKVAIGHFNISNLEGFWAVFRAAQKLNVPVIIGASEGERDFIGVRQVAALVKSVREEFNYPIYLNADHTYSFEKVKEAIDAGFDAVIYDGAKLSLEENTATTKKCVEYARQCGRDVLLEGELGFIGQSSKILDAVPVGVGLSGDALTKPEVAAQFVKETGIDLFAPSVGNFHGMVKDSGAVKKIDDARVSEIFKATGVPLVLHGGSGTSDEEFLAAIKSGIAIVHINTELRLAYRKGLALALQENPDEIAPYKYLKGALLAMEKVVEEKLALFNNLNTAK